MPMLHSCLLFINSTVIKGRHALSSCIQLMCCWCQISVKCLQSVSGRWRRLMCLLRSCSLTLKADQTANQSARLSHRSDRGSWLVWLRSFVLMSVFVTLKWIHCECVSSVAVLSSLVCYCIIAVCSLLCGWQLCDILWSKPEQRPK